MKKKKLYWIAGSVILNLLIVFVITRVVLNTFENKSMRFYTSREEEWILEEGTYYIYNHYELHEWYLANDYGDNFYIIDNNPARSYNITTEFNLTGNQDQIKIHSILYEYKTNQLLGSPFAMFEIDDTGTYKMDANIDFSWGIEAFIPKFYISDTHPRTIYIWETIGVVSAFLLVTSILGFSGVIYWNMRYEDFVDPKAKKMKPFDS